MIGERHPASLYCWHHWLQAMGPQGEERRSCAAAQWVCFL